MWPAGAFVLVWLILQVGIPTVMLVRPQRPSPFGWQMYAASRGLRAVEVEDASGTLARVEVRRFIPHPRTELDYAVLLPPFLCERLPGARAIVVTRSGGDEPPVRHACL